MRLTGRETTSKDVTVTVEPEEVLESIAKQIRLRFDFQVDGTFIRNGNEIWQNDPDHRHGSVNEEFVQKLSPQELQVFESYKTIAHILTGKEL